MNGSLWIEYGGEKFFGPGPMELLEKIAEGGSISGAAKQMGMSYKKAWELVNRLNTAAAGPMVLTHAGGKKGGGSSVSAEAKELITQHQDLRKRFLAFLEKETNCLREL